MMAATLLAGCASERNPDAVTYTGYYLICCTKGDIERLWQPGARVDLQLIPASSTRTTVNPTHKAKGTALLMGPYTDMTAANQVSDRIHVVHGSVITMDDRLKPSAAFITLQLPADLPIGYYKLVTKWDFGDRSFGEGESVVHVST
jgi:hypothetical protein